MSTEARTYKYEEIPFASILRDVQIGHRYWLVRESDGVLCGYFDREEHAAEVVAALNEAAKVTR